MPRDRPRPAPSVSPCATFPAPPTCRDSPHPPKTLSKADPAAPPPATEPRHPPANTPPAGKSETSARAAHVSLALLPPPTASLPAPHAAHTPQQPARSQTHIFEFSA